MKLLEYLIKYFPEDEELLYNLGILYEKTKNLEKAKESYQKAIEISPQDDFYYNLGEVLISLENWNEAIDAGTLTKEAMVYGWESVEECRKATAEGYRTVVMPGAYFYFDMRQTPREPGHDWAAIFDAKKPLSFDFKKQGFTPQELQNVVGVQASFFSEAYISHRDD